LIGNRPQSIWGETFSIAIRRRPSSSLLGMLLPPDSARVALKTAASLLVVLYRCCVAQAALQVPFF
jgi:hypothetical protein